MTGIILSGGRSRRMGENKAFLRVNGERLIDRTVRFFRAVFSDVVIVTSTPLDYLDQPVAVVTDILPEKGALGGIYTGLFFAAHEKAFVAACDMPFLNTAFMEYLISRADGYDIVVPETPAGLQPLNAIYARRCLPAIRRLLDRNRLKIIGFYPGHPLLKIPTAMIRSFDPEERMFMNINTPEDLTPLISAPCNTGAPGADADPQTEIP
jgi:molybdopterin-guanine dinucleotide biosynthesis protein A